MTDKGNDDEDTRDPEAEADDKEENDAMLVQMRTLRQTTSTHDDWLHRGPYLRDLPFHTYAEYVDRVRVSRNSSHEQQLFKFQPHYVLSKFYWALKYLTGKTWKLFAPPIYFFVFKTAHVFSNFVLS